MEAVSKRNLSPAWKNLLEQFEAQLEETQKSHERIIQKARMGLKVCQSFFKKLEESVRNDQFEDPEDEIFFRKEVKPKIFSRLIYYYKLFNIEVARPVGHTDDQIAFLQKELDQIKEFFEDNKFFYKYFRSGETYLDEKLFLQGDESNAVSLELYIHSTPAFTTHFDYIFSRILANEMLLAYLNKAIDALRGKSAPQEKTNGQPVKTLAWTESKSALIELIYAFKARGSFNNGKATLKEITDYLQLVFHVEITNPSRDFQDILSRKRSYTVYLDALKESYLKYIDAIDDKR